jgi:hypothetical protein
LPAEQDELVNYQTIKGNFARLNDLPAFRGQPEPGYERICGGKMIITFECKKCHKIFKCDVGLVSVPEGSNRPHFEKRLLCPTCGEVAYEDVRLTELGQSQLTAAVIDFCNGLGDLAESQCYGCDQYLPVNDLNLCDECAGKLDRDLIRERDWDYSASAFGLDPAKREELRRQVITRYGEKHELIAPSKRSAIKPKKRREKKGR